MLYVDEEHLDLHCYCYTSEEIEFDVDPHTINNEYQIARLLNFMCRVGSILNKEIVLTPENMPQKPLYRFNAETGEEKWNLEPDNKLLS